MNSQVSGGPMQPINQTSMTPSHVSQGMGPNSAMSKGGMMPQQGSMTNYGPMSTAGRGGGRPAPYSTPHQHQQQSQQQFTGQKRAYSAMSSSMTSSSFNVQQGMGGHMNSNQMYPMSGSAPPAQGHYQPNNNNFSNGQSMGGMQFKPNQPQYNNSAPPQMNHMACNTYPNVTNRGNVRGPVPYQTNSTSQFPQSYPNQNTNNCPTMTYDQQVHQNYGPGPNNNSYISHTPQQQQQQPQQMPPSGPSMGSHMQPHFSSSRNLHQHSPIPGNPTPPLTPASNMSYGPDVKPSFTPNGQQQTQMPAMDLKAPLAPHKDDELRLTFPVKDGIILPPFRLEHNLSVSNHVFMLKPSVFQTLMNRPDLELQLKCFHHEDRGMGTNWPASVQVSVNSTPLTIDRGPQNKVSHKPLYLKNVCQAERNTIQITVSACCCSHLFVLQLVHRPTVKSVLQGLLKKRLLPADACINKIKRNFGAGYGMSGGGGPGEIDGVEQTAIKVSLRCPISFRRMTLPARGSECKHIPCFDLQTYLELNAERGQWRCPICNKSAILEGLEVDQYIWGILNNTLNQGPEVDEVTMDSKANWTISGSMKTGMKEEVDHTNDCSSASYKRFKSTSPNSTILPTSQNWEVSQGLSPYAPLPPLPDIKAIGSNNGSSIHSNGMNGFHSSASDFAPLTHHPPLESQNPLEPLAAMEKSLSHHEQQMNASSFTASDRSPASSRGSTTHLPSITSQSPSHHPSHSTPNHPTPGTPSLGPKTPQTPAPHTPLTPGPSTVGTTSVPSTPSVGVSESSNPMNQSTTSSNNSLTSDLNDLNFDPAAVIDGDGQGQEVLNVS